MLRPADGIADGAGAVRPGIVIERPRHLLEDVAGSAADRLDQLGSVAAIVPLQDLEHAARLLERRILQRRWAHQCADLSTERVRLVFAGLAVLFGPRTIARLRGVAPTLLVVFPPFGVIAGEKAVLVLGVLEVLVNQ